MGAGHHYTIRLNSGVRRHINFIEVFMSGTVVVVSYRSLPEQTDTARREIGSLIATVQATEPDCGGFTIAPGHKRPDALHTN